jgi:hypothetical protein
VKCRGGYGVRGRDGGLLQEVGEGVRPGILAIRSCDILCRQRRYLRMVGHRVHRSSWGSTKVECSAWIDGASSRSDPDP